MTGQEHEVLLKAGRVATIHNAIRMSALEGKSIDGAIGKIGDALDELVEAYFTYTIWKKEHKDKKEAN